MHRIQYYGLHFSNVESNNLVINNYIHLIDKDLYVLLDLWNPLSHDSKQLWDGCVETTRF